MRMVEFPLRPTVPSFSQVLPPPLSCTSIWPPATPLKLTTAESAAYDVTLPDAPGFMTTVSPVLDPVVSKVVVPLN